MAPTHSVKRFLCNCHVRRTSGNISESVNCAQTVQEIQSFSRTSTDCHGLEEQGGLQCFIYVSILTSEARSKHSRLVTIVSWQRCACLLQVKLGVSICQCEPVKQSVRELVPRVLWQAFFLLLKLVWKLFVSAWHQTRESSLILLSTWLGPVMCVLV